MFCLCTQAIKYHKQELTISKEVNDRASEAATHGNLAVAYQALNLHEMALGHYHSHLNIARELKDAAGTEPFKLFQLKIILTYSWVEYALHQWFPTTAPGSTSAPRAALKCSLKILKSTILEAKN